MSAVPNGPRVYFIQNGDEIKIGHSIHVEQRLVDLRREYGQQLVLLATMPGRVDVEQTLHARFDDIRLRGEWFKATGELLAFIEQAKLVAPDGQPEVQDEVPPAAAKALARCLQDQRAELRRWISKQPESDITAAARALIHNLVELEKEPGCIPILRMMENNMASMRGEPRSHGGMFA